MFIKKSKPHLPKDFHFLFLKYVEFVNFIPQLF